MLTTTVRLLSRRALANAQTVRAAGLIAAQCRQYSSEAAKPAGSKAPLILGLAGILGGSYYAKESGLLDGFLGVAPAPKADFKPNYEDVKKTIADMLEADDYDDGSYGPILIRLAWHCAGTYDAATNTGGSNGATQRFSPEDSWGANAGLKVARDFLEPVKQKYPWISYADLYTLSGVVAVEEMGGPTIPWKPGRTDHEDGSHCPPDGRLPDASKAAPHLREIFYRMGFNDQEIVALSGAHTFGRCHTDRSGFDGPWTNAPTTFSNLYYQELINNKWSKKKWNGPLQYEDKSKTLMMLPTDMALLWDRKFKPFVYEYAKNEEKFAADFAAAFSKLLALGVPYPEEEAAQAA